MAFAQAGAPSSAEAGGSFPACFLELPNGQIFSLEPICGSGNASPNLTPTGPTFGRSSQETVHLQWRRNNPLQAVSNAPSPYYSQSIRDFDRVLYGD